MHLSCLLVIGNSFKERNLALDVRSDVRERRREGVADTCLCCHVYDVRETMTFECVGEKGFVAQVLFVHDRTQLVQLERTVL